MVEVREVLTAGAPDDAIAAYARRSARRVVTHDVRFARVCRADAIPHLWLRTPETEDARHLRERIDAVQRCFAGGAIRVMVTRRAVRCEGGDD